MVVYVQMGLKRNFTPAALEAPSTYLDTAIMEMMKKIMEAVTHLMKSFNRKEIQKNKSNFTLCSTSFPCGIVRPPKASKSTVRFYISCENSSHHKRPKEAFKPLIEFGGVGK